MSEERDNLIVLVDEDGEETEFELIDSFEFNGNEYVVLLPALNYEEENYEEDEEDYDEETDDIEEELFSQSDEEEEDFDIENMLDDEDEDVDIDDEDEE